MTELTLEQLASAVSGNAVAFRCVTELQPAGGAGDKVFPPTYEGGKYALEQRLIDGQRVPCVILDSVAAQANRIELALLEASRRGEAKLPVIAVDFSAVAPETGRVTSLEAPHRIADAILRDSELRGKRFRETPAGQALETASANNATGLFGWCPTALVFGVWDSTGARGGQGVKFARAFVSEIIGIDAQPGVKTASRVDPLGIQVAAGPLFESKDGTWTLDTAGAKVEKSAPKKLGKDGKPSEANHGNVTPTLTQDAGGVTMARALQFSTLSLPALRRLRFPVDSTDGEARNDAARTVLAALALCGAVLQQASGADLRSRCLLMPAQPATWELIRGPGQVDSFTLTRERALGLLEAAVAQARRVDLPWHDDELVLTPQPKLAELVKRNRALATSVQDEQLPEKRRRALTTSTQDA